MFNIALKENTNLSFINIVNTCRTAPKFNKAGMPESTKQNREKHGLGLKSVERVVNKYHGNMKMYFDQENMNFHTIYKYVQFK